MIAQVYVCYVLSLAHLCLSKNDDKEKNGKIVEKEIREYLNHESYKFKTNVQKIGK